MAKQVAVISDTHGYLSEGLLDALDGADLIVHAGDICSESDYRTLQGIAPVKLCLGNNDWGYDYGPGVKRHIHFLYEGALWQVCHYEEKLDLMWGNIAICGHTHKPFFEHTKRGILLMNPGSPTYPRTSKGPSIGWIEIEKGKVLDARIEYLAKDEDADDEDRGGFFFGW